jgi:gluconolactonase
MVSLTHAQSALEELIDPDAELRQLGSGFQFTEGPAWSKAGGFLVFSDIPADARWRWSEAGGMERIAHPTFKGNGMVYEPDGSLLVCEHVSSSVVRLKPSGERQLVAFHYRGNYLNSPNDVVTRSDGSIYFSDPTYGRFPGRVGVGREPELDFRGVYRVPPGGGELELVVPEDEFEQPNGLAFSPDESLLYVDDRDGIKAFDVAPDGSLSGARVFCDHMGSGGQPGAGNPDGMKVDERGNVWCTGRGGVWVIAPDGELLGILETPEVTANLAWGGPSLRWLFLTSSTTVHMVETKVASAPLPFH